MELSPAQALAARARFAPGDDAFIDGDLRLSFAEADARATAFASHLTGRGVMRGDRVLVLMKNSEFLATSIYALSRLGAIPVVGNWRLTASELEYVLHDSGAVGILAGSDFGDTAAALSEAVPRARFLVTDGPSARFAEAVGFTDALDSAPAGHHAEAGRPGDDAIIMYTSGTTGRPKGAVFTNANLFWSAQSMSSTIGWEARQRFLLVAPVFHIGGLSPLICNVLRGTATIFQAEFHPARVWETVAAEQITNMMTVPVMLRALIAEARGRAVDPSSLVNVSCGGAMVPPDLIAEFTELAAPVQVVYGITEFAGAVSYWLPSMGAERMQTQGRAVFGASMRVVTEDGLPAQPGELGELQLFGPQQFDRYWGKPAATATSVTPDGWYRSGDVASLDEDGFVTVLDRVNDIIISGGENIYPAEVEAIVATHEAVADVAVVGQADERWGETPVAHIVLREDATLTPAELIEHCRQRLASYKLPSRVEFVAEIPKNTLGKVLRRQLRSVGSGQ
ncbi:class I adenylate-forming enzyme family protein [Leucobacter sp. G161]|uniref:class I adenylate-forming enzyme family protein n=1 Tax=Leucobacter sp. G161 TaxID=663704 RepID=UPI00073B0BCF|nr:AMP-binding protein [Leucobacter sp. G161]KUF05632.1 hypothetical protein AUL38_03915 [Leucobacter sp. G161]